MKRWPRVIGAGLALLTLGAALGATAQSMGGVVLYNGAPLTTNARQIDGRTYVPVADVARTFGLQAVARGDGSTELTATGGAYQTDGIPGKTNEWIVTAAHRVMVLDARRLASYTRTDGRGTVLPANSTEELIVVPLRVRNASPKNEGKRITLGYLRTALAGADGRSVGIFVFDIPGGAAGDYTPELLPGAEAKATLVFRVPRDFAAKDLVLYLDKNQRTAATLRVALDPSEGGSGF